MSPGAGGSHPQRCVPVQRRCGEPAGQPQARQRQRRHTARPPAPRAPARAAQTNCCGGSAAALRRPVGWESRRNRSSPLLPLRCPAPRRLQLPGRGGARPGPHDVPPVPPGRGGGRKRRAVPGAESSGGGGAGGRTKRSAAGAGGGERGRDSGSD